MEKQDMLPEAETLTRAITYLAWEQNLAQEQSGLAKKREEKIFRALAQLPELLSWRHPLKWLYKRYLVARSIALQTKKEKYQQQAFGYLFAKAQLEEGNYEPAITTLGTSLFATWSIPEMNYTHLEGWPDPYFCYFRDLRNALISLQEREEKEARQDCP